MNKPCLSINDVSSLNYKGLDGIRNAIYLANYEGFVKLVKSKLNK